MLLIELKKNPENTKMMVVSWEFVNKEFLKSFKPIPGLLVVIPEKDIPEEFFISFKHFYIENNQLIKIQPREKYQKQ